MNNNQFEKILNERLDLTRSILAKKQEEYQHGSDRLSNFIRGGKILSERREKVIIGFMTKHFVSILDMVDEIGVCGTALPSEAMVNEKIGDTINYLILLEAALKETFGYTGGKE